jgi:hypothetical protein
MALVRPRFTDSHNVGIAQNNADFAIPFLDEDIPLYIDPFLLCGSHLRCRTSPSTRQWSTLLTTSAS